MKRYIIMIMCIASLALTSCKGTWIMYDTTQKDRLYFEMPKTPSAVSFALQDSDEMSYSVPVKLMGMPSKKDRTFQIEFIPAAEGEKFTSGNDEYDVLTAVEGTDFTIGDIVLPAGAVQTSIEFTLKRTSRIDNKYASINFHLVETDEFLSAPQDSTDVRAIVTGEYRFFVTDGEPARPYWWDSSNASYNLIGWGMYLGNFYAEKFRKLLAIFHEMETKNKALYDQLVEKVGYNMDKEKIAIADFATATWAAYVLQPLYDYYKAYYAAHPEDPNVEVCLAKTTGLTSGEYWRDPNTLYK